MRVAEERGTMLGGEVGYSIRFDDCSDKESTRIKVRSVRMLFLNHVFSLVPACLPNSPFPNVHL